MSLYFELCRLCLTNCSMSGIVVYPEDLRHQKIRDCLSIVVSLLKKILANYKIKTNLQISDNRFKICQTCDNKVNCFYQFRLDSVRVQHEFAGNLNF